MTKKEKSLLIRQATKLTTLGTTVECARGRLKKLVEQGIPYSSSKMLEAYERFEKADSEWKRLEAEHLELRFRLGIK